MPTATAPGTGPGPSLSDVKKDPGLAPEAMVRSENLHKASTDRTENDIVEGSGARDIWVLEGTILVRADDEAAAVGKLTGALGVAFDARGVKARPAKPADLVP